MFLWWDFIPFWAFLLTSVLAASNRTRLTPQFFPEHDSQRVQIKYGPFEVPDMMTMNGMKSFEAINIEQPCSDCLITWMQAGLEYPNGTYANADTGMWLHHTVLGNLEQQAVICSRRYDQFFASGNERTAIDICVNGTDKAGYYLSPTATLGHITELMNMAMTPRSAVVTITYEYIPAPIPSDFSKVSVLWLDIAGCDHGSEEPAKFDQAFTYTSPVWTSTNTTGRITFVAGHLHDGGTRLDVRKDGDVICESTAVYGANSHYIDGPAVQSMEGMETSMSMASSTSSAAMAEDTIHISSLSTCVNIKGDIKIGDTMSVVAYYNTSLHAPMKNTDGSLEPIMGISLVYVAENLQTTNTSASVSSSAPGSSTSAAASSNFAANGVGGSLQEALWAGRALGALAAAAVV